MGRYGAPPAVLDWFNKAGRFLYGDHFQAPLSVELGVPKDTVKNWRQGKSSIPPGVIVDMLEMVEERASGLEKLREAAVLMMPERQT